MAKRPFMPVLAVLLLVGGIALFVLSVVRGNSTFYLFLIIPVITTRDPPGILGILMFIAGLVLLPIARLHDIMERSGYDEHYDTGYDIGYDTGYKNERARERGAGENGIGVGGDNKKYIRAERAKSRVGGVIFLGPIPIVFGSDRGTAGWMVIVAVAIGILMVLMIALSFLAR